MLRTEDPDSPRPNPNPNKFGLMEDLTDVPRTDPDGEPNPNKPRFIQDFTEVPRTEDDRNPMVEVREVIAADSNSTNRLFGSLDKTSGLPNDNIQGTPGNHYLVGKHYREMPSLALAVQIHSKTLTVTTSYLAVLAMIKSMAVAIPIG